MVNEACPGFRDFACGLGRSSRRTFLTLPEEAGVEVVCVEERVDLLRLGRGQHVTLDAESPENNIDAELCLQSWLD